jgi:DNA-binding Lrp family transcriptional regulator
MESSDSWSIRPDFQLRSLPVKYRWEATRRHPWYNVYWNSAKAFHSGESLGNEILDALQPLAVHMLYRIGISGEPPDPSLEFDNLKGDQMKTAWLSGAVHPVSFRGLLATLVASVEPAALRDLGMLLSSIDPGDPKTTDQAVLRLVSMGHPSLDLGPPEPYVSINPAASGRDIGQAIKKLLAEWKQKHGLSELRVRSDKFDDYLTVWDLREGWSQGNCDRSKEHSLAEIARKLSLPQSTVKNRYRDAFKLIIGHPYQASLWHRYFEDLKFSDLIQGGAGSPLEMRRSRSAGRAPASETSLGNFPAGYGPVSGGFTLGNQAAAEVWLDLAALIEMGKSDAEIAEEMEIPEDAVAAVRRRIEDSLDTREK